MFVVIDILPGTSLNELMAFMTQRTITFSVTDQLSKLCSSNNEKREMSTQTEQEVVSMSKSRNTAKSSDECSSPCSSATPSEPMNNSKWEVKNEEEECDEMARNQLIMTLFSNIKDEVNLGTLAQMEEMDPENYDASKLEGHDSPSLGGPGGAYRLKQAYASTKRGVCHVCHREVSLITTHRKRHAITHLGFKTLKCAICHKYFSRQDLATGHFKKDHPTLEFVPFIDTMTADAEKELAGMMDQCFPDELAPAKRAKSAIRLENYQ